MRVDYIHQEDKTYRAWLMSDAASMERDLGALVKTELETQIGPVTCWKFDPTDATNLATVTCKKLGDVKAEIERRLFGMIVKNGGVQTVNPDGGTYDADGEE